MKDKELRRLSRQELLEMLIEQTKRADELQEKLNQLEAQLESRELTINNAGSLAEAALRINKVFEAADKAAAQYIEAVKKMGGEGYVSSSSGADIDNLFESLLSEFSKDRPPKLVRQAYDGEKDDTEAFKPVSKKVREIKHLKN